MATRCRNACSMVAFIELSSPAWPPQATLAEVKDGNKASCVPSAMASGSSPMSQLRSMLFLFRSVISEQSPRPEKPLLFEKSGARYPPTHSFEANFVARPQLPEAVKIRGNHVGDLRISPGSLLLDEENN